MEEKNIGQINSIKIIKENAKINLTSNNKQKIVETKQNYSHYMIKEIYDTPDSIRELLKHYNNSQSFFDILPKEILKKTQEICFIACGTSYNAGLVAKDLINKIAKVSVSVFTPINFVLTKPEIKKDTLYFFISQSGTTTDSLIAMEYVLKHTENVATLTNVQNSKMAILSNFKFYAYANEEKAIASTKVYTNQVAFMYLLACTTAISKEKAQEDLYGTYVSELQNLFVSKKDIATLHQTANKIVQNIKQPHIITILGHNSGSIIGSEAVLKFTETTYIPTLHFTTSEYLHGPIALVHENVWHFVIISNAEQLNYTNKVIDKILANNGNIVVMANENIVKIINPVKNNNLYLYKIPNTNEFYDYISMIVAFQLVAFELCVALGNNPDSPRHLTKSVI